METLIVDCPLKTKSLLRGKRKLSKQRPYLQRIGAFLAGLYIKIYVTPFLHRTIAIIPLSPALFTTTQEKTGLELENIENIKCCKYN